MLRKVALVLFAVAVVFAPSAAPSATRLPRFDPANFVDRVDNPWFR